MNNSVYKKAEELTISIMNRLISLEKSKRDQYLILTTVALIAIILRFYKLGTWSLWADEIVTLNHAKSGLVWNSTSDVLTSIVLALLNSTDEWSARLAPALIGIISIIILYFPTRKLFGAVTALCSSLLLALSPWHLYWSQNVRFYTALLLLYSLAVFSFYFGLEEKKPQYYFLAILFWTLGVQERLLAFFFIPVILGYLMLIVIFRLKKLGELQLYYLVPFFLLIGVFCIYKLFVENSTLGVSYASTVEIKFLGLSRNPIRVLASIVYWLGIPLFCFGLFGGLHLWLRENKKESLFLGIGTLGPLFALLVLSPISAVDARYTFMTLPFWTILGAVGIKGLFSETKERGKFLVVGVLFILVADPLGQNVLYYQYQNGNRRDWKNAFASVQQMQQDGDLIITNRKDLGEYYLGHEVAWSHEIKTTDVIKENKRTWFVMSDGTLSAGPEYFDWLDHNSQLISIWDVHIPGKTLFLRIYFYDPVKLQQLTSD